MDKTEIEFPVAGRPGFSWMWTSTASRPDVACIGIVFGGVIIRKVPNVPGEHPGVVAAGHIKRESNGKTST